jgi:hypothetical protein
VLGTPTASKAEARACAIERAEVLLTTSVYFGIDCGRCDHRNPLVEVISGLQDLQWFVPRVPPFEVHCGNCGASRTRRQRHVILLEAPTIEDLEDLPGVSRRLNERHQLCREGLLGVFCLIFEGLEISYQHIPSVDLDDSFRLETTEISGDEFAYSSDLRCELLVVGGQ